MADKKSKEETKKPSKTEGRVWNFPKHNISVLASSMEEALDKLKKQLNNLKND